MRQFKLYQTNAPLGQAPTSCVYPKATLLGVECIGA